MPVCILCHNPPSYKRNEVLTFSFAYDIIIINLKESPHKQRSLLPLPVGDDENIQIFRKLRCTVVFTEIAMNTHSPSDESIRAKRIALVNEYIALRHEKGLCQKDMEMLSGVKQSAIARIETGRNVPRISTLVKLLVPLGKTLAIVSTDEQKEL